MKTKRHEQVVYNITDLPKPEELEQPKQPNYLLRRLGAGVVVATGLTLIGVEAAPIVAHIGENAYDQHNCQPGSGSVTVLPGETAWADAGSPLANKLNIPVDEAMNILSIANPNIRSLGDVQAGTTIRIPDCR